MKRIAIATALFCALVLPAAASAVGGNQDVTLTVSKAVEATAGSTSGLTSIAPSGASNVNRDSGQTTAATLRSNAAWTATLAASSATMVENDARTGGETLANALLYSTDGSSYSNPVPTSATQVGSGSRNSDNNTQSYSLYFRQPVSWADEAGDYKLVLTHSITN